jgi:hypothetical protein
VGGFALWDLGTLWDDLPRILSPRASTPSRAQLFRMTPFSASQVVRGGEPVGNGEGKVLNPALPRASKRGGGDRLTIPTIFQAPGQKRSLWDLLTRGGGSARLMK